jgi:cholesterol transport system auxiliary component
VIARVASCVWVLAMAAVFAGCATPDKPVRPMLYDFGPGAVAAVASPGPPSTQPPLVLADIGASDALDGSALLYRLGYADENQLRPYALARWSAPPPQLVRQRLRDRLGRDHTVLDPSESAALARTSGAARRVLRVQLEEFSHYFETQAQSWGLLRLRATVTDDTAAGERLVGQRGFVVRRPAVTPDAAGGVRALSEAADTAAEEIGRWLKQLR